MVGRLLIQGGPAAAFKLSKAGVDVETASFDNTIFDLAMGKVGGVFMSGSFAFAAMSVVTINGLNYRRYTLSFGKTFPTPPQVFAMTSDPSVTGTHLYYNYYVSGAAYIKMRVEVTTTQALIYFEYAGSPNAWPPNIYYVVLQA